MYDISNCTYAPGNGIAGGNYDVYGADRRIPRSMTAFTAIAWYNSLEILVLLLFAFRKYSGLYFWSLLVTTISVIPYATGAWMKQNSVSHNDNLTESLAAIGWIIMVPGQSIVLYSRLHLITRNEKLLRCILWFIIINSFVLCTPTVILDWGSRAHSPEPFTRGYAIMEKIQMTVFSVQEFCISGIYLWKVRRALKVIFDGRTRNLMWQLIAMNIFVMCLDIALLTVEFFDLYMIQTTLKSLVYSVKLKVEFGVLSNMVSVVTSRKEKHCKRGIPRNLSSVDVEKSADGEVDKKEISSAGEYSVRGDDDLEIRSLQQNLPTNWRLSIGHENSTEPTLLEGRETVSSAKSSCENLYPGRLG